MSLLHAGEGERKVAKMAEDDDYVSQWYDFLNYRKKYFELFVLLFLFNFQLQQSAAPISQYPNPFLPFTLHLFPLLKLRTLQGIWEG